MSSILKIKRAAPTDEAIAWQIMEACGHWLNGLGLIYWSNYFTKQKIAELFHETDFYLGCINGQPISLIAMSLTPPQYFVDDHYLNHFTNSPAKSVYLITIATLPTYHGHGYATQLLEFAENEAKKVGALWMRLDCLAEDKKLVDFYEKRDYQKVGTKPMNEGNQENYWLLEKMLSEK